VRTSMTPCGLHKTSHWLFWPAVIAVCSVVVLPFISEGFSAVAWNSPDVSS
jgi:hypothetical protein